MVTLIASTVLSTTTTAPAASTTTTSPASSILLIKPHFPLPKPLSNTLAATAAAVVASLLSSPSSSLADSSTFHLYYGTATNAVNYGGYSGNKSKKDSTKYIYTILDGWKELLISKEEKGTNSTGSEFYNPKKHAERVYLTFLFGSRTLVPIGARLYEV